MPKLLSYLFAKTNRGLLLDIVVFIGNILFDPLSHQSLHWCLQ